MGLNFKTLRPRQDVLADYAHILERIYDPAAYAGRLRRSGEDARQFRPEAADAPAACGLNAERIQHWEATSLRLICVAELQRHLCSDEGTRALESTTGGRSLA